MTHTPGPWSYDGKFTVGIPHKDGDTFFRTNPEDARLIAAAPDLLEALELVWDKVLTEYHSKDSPVRQTVEAAIAKARGSRHD